MTKPVSHDMQKKYSFLLKKFGMGTFTYQQMYDLPKCHGYWYLVIFKLNRGGWVEKSQHYKGVDIKLKPLKEIFLEME
jgi:hypothetical protein